MIEAHPTTTATGGIISLLARVRAPSSASSVHRHRKRRPIDRLDQCRFMRDGVSIEIRHLHAELSDHALGPVWKGSRITRYAAAPPTKFEMRHCLFRPPA